MHKARKFNITVSSVISFGVLVALSDYLKYGFEVLTAEFIFVIVQEPLTFLEGKFPVKTVYSAVTQQIVKLCLAFEGVWIMKIYLYHGFCEELFADAMPALNRVTYYRSI